MEKYALIVAGGSGLRMGTEIAKQFLPLGEKVVLMQTINAFHATDSAIKIVVVLPENQHLYWKELCKNYNFKIEHKIISGGKTRYNSVENGLKEIPNSAIVAIHDGVRPLVSGKTIEESYKKAEEFGNAIPIVPIRDSVRAIKENGDSEIVDRTNLRLVQTPQTFLTDIIKKAYESTNSENFTDDASVVEHTNIKINSFVGDFENIKITTPNDLIYAETFLKK